MATRGIMADNMFLGKSALLNWLNDTLQIRLEKIEDTCTGAVACQLMDILHPGTVNMKKVDFNVRSDYEYVGNYKELQQSFNKVGIDRAFNVSQLSKGKRQDNNEFMQWFKGYWDSVTGGQDFVSIYDAVGRRKLCKSGDWKKFSVGEGGARPVTGERPTAAQPATTAAAPVRRAPLATNNRAPSGGMKEKVVTVVDPQLEAKVQELTEQVTEMKLKVETAERERDFYFDKLRDIEIMCQAPELADIPILKIVEKVLYAADSAEAKVAMAEAQEKFGAQLLAVPSPAPAVVTSAAVAEEMA